MVPLYVINMERSCDRWQSIKSHLVQHGLKPVRIPAVDGEKIEDAELVAMGVSLRTADRLIGGQRRHSFWMIDAKGAVGATLSHTRAWEALNSDANASYGVVLEDDAIIKAQDLSGAIANLTKSNLHGFDLVLLTSNAKIWDPFPGHSFNRTPDTNSVHAVTKDFWGGHGYCLSKRAASVLLQHAFPIEQHVENYIASLSRLSLLRVGVTSSVLIGLNPRWPSTISHGLPLFQVVLVFLAFLASIGIVIFIWRRRRRIGQGYGRGRGWA